MAGERRLGDVRQAVVLRPRLAGLRISSDAPLYLWQKVSPVKREARTSVLPCRLSYHAHLEKRRHGIRMAYPLSRVMQPFSLLPKLTPPRKLSER